MKRSTKWYQKQIQKSKTQEELKIILLMACIQTTAGEMKRKALAHIVEDIRRRNEKWEKK